jgi:hypothetical protein
MLYQVNQAALQKYKHVSQLNTLYATDDAHPSVYVNSTESNDNTYASPRIAKYKKTLKDKSPASVDRSLRNQGWVGGYTPYGFPKAKRSWKPKEIVSKAA